MPTGYAYIVEEKDDVPFREYATRCMRAMGHCISMRDEALNVPPPQQLEPSDYHVRSLQKAEVKLRELKAKSPEDLRAFAVKKLENYRASKRRSHEAELVKRLRYERMLKLVERWLPPTEDHAGLKHFMREQILLSCEHLATEPYEEEPPITETEIQEHIEFIFEQAESDIVYHKKQSLEESVQVTESNEFLQQFWDSLDEQCVDEW